MNDADPNKQASIFILDDHPIVIEGIKHLIARHNDRYQVIGEAHDAKTAMQMITTHNPDLAIIDLALGGSSGLDFIKDLRAQRPDMPVLVLSMHEENVYAERALRAGARGYIMKHEVSEKLTTAIERILAGQIYLSDRMLPTLVERMVEGRAPAAETPASILSDRELQIFELIGSGLSTNDIAQRLHLSVKTIEWHRANLKKKLDLKNSIELYQRAYGWVNQQDGVQP